MKYFFTVKIRENIFTFNKIVFNIHKQKFIIIKKQKPLQNKCAYNILETKFASSIEKGKNIKPY